MKAQFKKRMVILIGIILSLTVMFAMMSTASAAPACKGSSPSACKSGKSAVKTACTTANCGAAKSNAACKTDACSKSGCKSTACAKSGCRSAACSKAKCSDAKKAAVAKIAAKNPVYGKAACKAALDKLMAACKTGSCGTGTYSLDELLACMKAAGQLPGCATAACK